MKYNKAARWLRWSILVGLLLWVMVEAYLHQVLGGGKAPSVHALCPFGALESLFTLLFMGSFIQKIYSGTVVLLVLTVVTAILFRRSFCGLLCPFGTLQELFGRLGRKLFKKRFSVPVKVDKPLRLLKYIVLPLTVVMAWLYGALWMAPYDPYSAFAHITAAPDAIKEDPLAIIGFALLALTVVGSLLYDRFFCKYLCPVGALYAVLGKLSPTRIERSDKLCSHCNVCSRACPVNIDVAKATKITDMECINCNECVAVCPRKGALEVKTAKKALHPLAMIFVVAGLFFGTVLIAQVTGNYQIIPSALKEGEIIPVSEVKGYYNIEEAAIATGLSLKEVYEKLGIPEYISKNTKLKDISKEAPEYNFDEAKEKAGGTVSDAGQPAGQTAGQTAGQATAAAEAGAAKVDVSGIKGSMTIRTAADLLGMDLKEFYKLFKIPENIPAQTQMKSISAAAPDYNFEQVKESLK